MQNKNSLLANPHSAIRNPHSGISLIEILVSMGVLAIGLLGVAALFPVGGHYLRQGDISDRADAIAQAAFNDAAARGMLDPDRWLAARWGNSNAPQVSVFDREFGPFMQTIMAPRATALNSTDPFQRREAMRQMNLFAGSVFVIDPLGAASAMNATPGPTAGLVSGSVGYLPASTDPDGQFTNNINPQAPGWFPWLGPANATYPDALNVSLVNGWPIRRLTVSTGALPMRLGTRFVTAPMTAQAEVMVTASDDLSIQLDDYNGNPYEANPDNPSQQFWSASQGGRMARQTRGDFTWCLTVVPTTPEARNALGSDPESHYYDVSVVVFYKRSLGDAFELTNAPFYGHESMTLSERQCRASIGTTGVGGGQLRLFPSSSEISAAPDKEPAYEKLSDGQWVMLFGPHPDSTPTRPLLFCQWYKVVSVEDDPAADKSLFVRGPDWPWTPLPDSVDPTIGIQNDLRVIILPDVASVHTRTMKLSAGSAWGID